jgi:tetratricopeptide (TPR) repeat protein/transcriptional regulator with XRE-family HTH domain
MPLHRLDSFAEQLRRYRQQAGLTQEELAARARLSARGIRALEQGERTLPHRDTVRLLADALRLEPENRASFEKVARAGSGGYSLAQKSPSPIGGFLGAAPLRPLVGRDGEMHRLLGGVDEQLSGRGKVVILAGEPGIGKTRLAQELTVYLRARDFVVATGQCYAPQQGVPYYPFLEALAGAWQAAPVSLRAEIPTRWPHLIRLLPNRLTDHGDGDVHGYDAQQALFWATSDFLARLTALTPVALLLDDLHWADESTLKLFQHLARHLHAEAFLLVGSYRDTEVTQQHPLERALRDLLRDGLLQEIMVRRLNRENTAALATSMLGGAAVSDQLAELLHRYTDGNPFFTLEVIRGMVERGDVFQQDEMWDCRTPEQIAIPRSVRSAIGERLSRLGEVSRSVLQEASVLGQTFAYGDLQAMADRAEEEVEITLDAAMQAGLISVTQSDDYAFSHALVRQVLYDELSPRARKRLHGAAGQTLERMPAVARDSRAGELAWHFAHADEPARALPYGVRAADQAEAVFAHAEAEKYYRTALALAQDARDALGEAEVLRKLGAVLRVLARYEEALQVLDRAVMLYREVGNCDGEARTMRELGMAHYYRGTPDRGLARIQEVAERLNGLPAVGASSEAMGELSTALTICLWPLARYSEVLVAAEHAVREARAANATRTLSMAETMHGKALTMVGSLPDARRVLQEAISSFAVGGDPWEPGQPQGDLGRTYMDEGDLQLALQWLERSRALIDAAHEPAESAWIASCLGEVMYVQGHWSAAESAYDDAIHLATEAGSRRYLSYALMHRAELRSSRGEWEQAARDIDEGEELALACAAIPALRKAQRLRAERDLSEGNARSAVDRLQPLVAQATGEWPRAFPPPVLAEAYLELGDTVSAEQLVAQRVQRLQTLNHRRALVLWRRVEGTILARQRNWEAAERVFEASLALARSIGYPYAEGLTLHDYGVACARDSKAEWTRERLETALSIFRQLGALPHAERTDLAVRAMHRARRR